MNETTPLNLLALNPGIDRHSLSAAFARDGRVQIRNVLDAASAEELRAILARQTNWGVAWGAGADGPHGLRQHEFARLDDDERVRIGNQVAQSANMGHYAFTYARYPILDAYRDQWAPGSPHDILFEHLNDRPMLDLVRQVTGIADLAKADAQATLFAPGHFLGVHEDAHVGPNARIGYVLNLGPDDWAPDWGGYLNFLDADEDIVAGYRPRFNALNLFAVPTRHAVSYVPPYAPIGRFSITGWFRTN